MQPAANPGPTSTSPQEGRANEGQGWSAPWTSGGVLALLPEALEGSTWPLPARGLGGGLGILALGPALATGVLVLGTRPRAWIQRCLVPGHMLMERMWPRLEKINRKNK